MTWIIFILYVYALFLAYKKYKDHDTLMIAMTVISLAFFVITAVVFDSKEKKEFEERCVAAGGSAVILYREEPLCIKSEDLLLQD